MIPLECHTCVYQGHRYKGKPACAAFPEGIPQEIYDGEVSHKEPYPGDHGIQYKYQERADVVLAAILDVE